MILRSALCGILLLPAFAFAQRATFDVPPINRLAPYVPSPPNVVERMLEVANLKPGETLYDLGSGDGRVLITAAQRFRAKAVGVEISPKEIKSSTDQIRRLKLDNLCQVIEGDLLQVDLSSADVVTLYLLTTSNDLLRPNLEKYLHKGARVVSHDYQIRGWVPTKLERVHAHNREHTLYVYEMPPRKK